MNRLLKIITLTCAIVLGLSALSPAEDAARQPYREAQWTELVPESWNPGSVFDEIGGIEELEDDDPRAMALFEKFLEEWQNAPGNPEMDGQVIRILGFVAPLDWEDDSVLKEFLLVPYFGACIHTPPPPPNQIIHVEMSKSVKNIRMMDMVWIYGKLNLEKVDSGSMGVSGYTMIPEKVELYRE